MLSTTCEEEDGYDPANAKCTNVDEADAPDVLPGASATLDAEREMQKMRLLSCPFAEGAGYLVYRIIDLCTTGPRYTHALSCTSFNSHLVPESKVGAVHCTACQTYCNAESAINWHHR